MLGLFGVYLEKEHPTFDSAMIPALAEFEKDNPTFMRSMLLTTVKEMQNPNAK